MIMIIMKNQYFTIPFYDFYASKILKNVSRCHLDTNINQLIVSYNLLFLFLRILHWLAGMLHQFDRKVHFYNRHVNKD